MFFLAKPLPNFVRQINENASTYLLVCNKLTCLNVISGSPIFAAMRSPMNFSPTLFGFQPYFINMFGSRLKNPQL